MIDSTWYSQLTIEDYAYDVTEEVTFEGEYSIQLKDRQVMIQVEFIQSVANEDEIEHLTAPPIAQQQLWEHYIEHYESIHELVLQSIFNHYQHIEERYRQAWQIDPQDPTTIEERDRSIPYIQKYNQIADYITLQSFLIGDSLSGDTYYLNFHCTWDTEHGLGVKMINHQPVHVSTFYTAYDID